MNMQVLRRAMVLLTLPLVICISAFAGVSHMDFNSGDWASDKYGDVKRYFWSTGDDVDITGDQLVYTCGASYHAAVVQFENPQMLSGGFSSWVTIDFESILDDTNIGNLSWAGIVVYYNSTYRYFCLIKDDGRFGYTAGTWLIAAFDSSYGTRTQIEQVTATSKVRIAISRSGNYIRLYAGYDNEEIHATGVSGDYWTTGLTLQYRVCLANTSGNSYTGGVVNVDDITVVWSSEVEYCSSVWPFINENNDGADSYTGFSDPRVINVSGTSYLTGTSFACYKTTTLEPDEVTQYEFDFTVTPVESSWYGFWGVHPYKHSDGSWHLYLTGHFASDPDNFKISHFEPTNEEDDWTSSTPITAWTLSNHIIEKELGNGMYENNVVVDTNGDLYFIWNEYVSAGDEVVIKAHKMSSPSTLDGSTSDVVLLSPEDLVSEYRDGTSGIQITEGTFIKKIGSYWVLVYAVGNYDADNYKIGWAYSSTLIPSSGEYTKVKAYDGDNIWGNSSATNEVMYLLQSQLYEWYNYAGFYVNGPGIGNIIQINNDYYLVFHARRSDKSTPGTSGWDRYTWKIPLTVNMGTGNDEDWIKPNWASVPAPYKPDYEENFESSWDWSNMWSSVGTSWARVTAKGYDGSCSAEIDGNVSDSALVSTSTSFSSKTTAYITFWWWIDSTLDTGEYIAFDVNTGSGWVEKAKRRGNVDTENVWAKVDVNVDVTSKSSIQLRVRGKMSLADEDAYIDGIELRLK